MFERPSHNSACLSDQYNFASFDLFKLKKALIDVAKTETVLRKT